MNDSTPSAPAQARVWVHYAQFYLADPELGTDGLPTPEQATDGILATGRDGACVRTGLNTGYVTVSAQCLPQRPDTLPAGAWGTSSEGTLESTTGSLLVHSWEDGAIEDLPDLAAHGPGLYHLRISARGRDQGQAIDTTGPGEDSGEHYFLETWPIP
ncbi:hypothetical protein ACIPW5_36945 [Streptomyces sp. NPDC090077]|uniref:hypothetical protein n=1 Tax=Streptomyces sp. NPDC090077 TaxID=3365938 RepID=UPI00381FC04E